jgi:tryptophan-rich sensory protein
MNIRLFNRISIAIVVCLLIGFLGSIATQASVDDWFTTLEKPFFNPPSWLFAPVWSVLYVMMGIAAGLVWYRGLHHVWVKTALYHFLFQLFLNLSWSVVFFGLQRPFWALLVIVALIILLVLTIRWFKIADKKAAYLLIPYLIWVVFAAALNFEIWRLNA